MKVKCAVAQRKNSRLSIKGKDANGSIFVFFIYRVKRRKLYEESKRSKSLWSTIDNINVI